MIEEIKSRIEDGKEVFEKMSKDDALLEKISLVSEICCQSLLDGGKIMFMGNGGSAADSQHLATELVSRYLKDRRAIAAIALTVDSSALTAIGNDFSFDSVFSRQIEAIGKRNDVIFGITTSGNSKNVIQGIETAKSLGILTVALTGKDGGRVSELADHSIIVPSDSVPLIQQCHIAIGYIICENIENSAT